MEEWRIVEEFPEYEVSSLGRLRGPYGISKSKPGKDGYIRVSLYYGKCMFKTKTLHKLVCKAFHGPPPFPGAVALHENDVKHHNEASNLYWGTHKDNAQDRWNNGHTYRGGSRKVHLK